MSDALTPEERAESIERIRDLHDHAATPCNACDKLVSDVTEEIEAAEKRGRRAGMLEAADMAFGNDPLSYLADSIRKAAGE